MHAGRWHWALWLALCLLLLLSVSTVSRANETSSETLLPSISEKVSSLKANFERLQQLLNERKIALQQARQQLTELQTELQTLRQHLTTSQLETQRLTLLLRQLEETSSQLQTSFDDYKQSALRQIRNRTILGIAGIAAGVLIAIIF